jgi:nitrite reductase (NADH) small subunit
MPEILVCKTGELGNGDVRIVRSLDLEIAVIRHEDAWYAFRNLCPHQGGPACEGLRMPLVIEEIGEGGVSLGQSYDEDEMHIVCPWHGYEFRMSDGVHPRDKRVRLQKFAVVERDENIYVAV